MRVLRASRVIEKEGEGVVVTYMCEIRKSLR